MRTLLLAGSSLLALSASVGTAMATTFDYTGAFVSYFIPSTGTYSIQAVGAQGGNAPKYFGSSSAIGGDGALVQADFDLTKGEALLIMVGGAGENGAQDVARGAGGGGGTFVIGPGATPLLIAGGGGGAGGGNSRSYDGTSATSISATSGGGSGGSAGSGGSGGAGGGSVSVVAGTGGGGSGFRGAGGDGGIYAKSGTGPAQGGGSFAGGLSGGAGSDGGGSGGFGGGGGGGGVAYIGGGGGGGGYSGGGGGGAGSDNGGGAGGSFLSGTDQYFTVATPSGDGGSVTITELSSTSAPVPEPASLALFGSGLVSLLAWRCSPRRR